MPDVGRLEARYKSKRVGPISARVPRDRSFGTALGALLHVARLRGSAAVQPGAISPFRIQLDSVGWISHHQARAALAQQPGYSFRTGGVRAENAVRPQHPEIAEPRHRRLRQRWRGVRSLLVIERQQAIDFARVEPCEAEVEI